MHLLHRHPKNKHLKELTETQRKDPPHPKSSHPAISGSHSVPSQVSCGNILSFEISSSNPSSTGKRATPGAVLPWGDGPGPPKGVPVIPSGPSFLWGQLGNDSDSYEMTDIFGEDFHDWPISFESITVRALGMNMDPKRVPKDRSKWDKWYTLDLGYPIFRHPSWGALTCHFLHHQVFFCHKELGQRKVHFVKCVFTI